MAPREDGLGTVRLRLLYGGDHLRATERRFRRDRAADEVTVLRLRVEAALSVVPLIAPVVAGLADRRAVVGDLVDSWLALPTADRERYQGLGGSDGSGLERFGWDYVDAVERGADDGASPDGPRSVELAEGLACRRWSWHLRRIRRGWVRG